MNINIKICSAIPMEGLVACLDMLSKESERGITGLLGEEKRSSTSSRLLIRFRRYHAAEKKSMPFPTWAAK